jgi:hypothetical protein
VDEDVNLEGDSEILFGVDSIWYSKCDSKFPTFDSTIFSLGDLALSARKNVESDSDGDSDSDSNTDPTYEDEDNAISQALLACSLLHLHDSNWTKAAWGLDEILVSYAQSGENKLDHWKLFLPCCLGDSINPLGSEISMEDNIISFGILLMEMETKKKVRISLDKDFDWETGQASRAMLLRRTLEERKRKLTSDYIKIGKRCLELIKLAEKISHPALRDELRVKAAIYRYITHPLILKVANDRSISCDSFYSVATEPTRGEDNQDAGFLDESLSLVLFDDNGDSNTLYVFCRSSLHSNCTDRFRHKSEATKFLQDIQAFVDRIRNLSSPNLPTWKRPKIRIAIIDTGIDKEDTMIRGALEDGRIKESRGFTSDPEDVQDQHSHGTHITRLLLTLAPAAEIYIAKVSNQQHIGANDLHRIVEVFKVALSTGRVFVC